MRKAPTDLNMKENSRLDNITLSTKWHSHQLSCVAKLPGRDRGQSRSRCGLFSPLHNKKWHMHLESPMNIV